jgi:Matrixin
VRAVTLSIFSSSGPQAGDLIDANITLNQSFTSTQTDLQSLVAHELGHVLGLAHPDECGKDFNVLMRSASLFASGSPCFALDPTTADINGAKRIYGLASPTPLPTPTVRAVTTPAPTATAVLPLFVKPVRSCQVTLAAQSRRYATALHQSLQKCFDRLLKDIAERSRPTTPHPCTKALDTSNPRSPISRARTASISRIVSKCEGLSPVDLDQPCDGAVTTMTQLATCLMNQHKTEIERMVSAEYANACDLLRIVGLDSQYPIPCLLE